MTTTTLNFGIPFFSGSKTAVRAEITKLAEKDHGTSVIFANAHVIVEAHQDGALKEALRGSDLIVPDGVPLTWVMHVLGDKLAQRYSGPDLMADLLKETPNKKHFFLGSTPEVLAKIEARFKGKAAGYYSPPFAKVFSEEELQKQLELIVKSKADYIWIGLGAPKQERYAVEMAKRAPRGVWLAIGAAFDFYGRNKSRAPRRMQSLGLEWAYRMFTEPRRLAIRYAKTNPVFIKLALAEIANARFGKDRAAKERLK